MRRFRVSHSDSFGIQLEPGKLDIDERRGNSRDYVLWGTPWAAATWLSLTWLFAPLTFNTPGQNERIPMTLEEARNQILNEIDELGGERARERLRQQWSHELGRDLTLEEVLDHEASTSSYIRADITKS